MSATVMEKQMSPKDRDAMPKSLLALMRLPPLRLPSPSRRSTVVADTKAPLSSTVTVTAVAVTGAVFNCIEERRQDAFSAENITNTTSQQPIAVTTTLPAPTALRIMPIGETAAEQADCIDFQCSQTAALSSQLSEPQPFKSEPSIPSIKSPQNQIETATENASPQQEDSKIPLMPKQQPSLVQSDTIISKVGITRLEFDRLGDDSYVAKGMLLDRELQEIFDRKLRSRISGILRRLKLNDTRISLESAMVGVKPTPAAMKPTILCMCLTKDQRKAIVNAFSKMDFIPGVFCHKVVIFELKKSSTGQGSSHLGPMIGQTVEVVSQQYFSTLCGTSARILLGDESIDYAKCTIGGLIIIDESLYGLTTAHGFATTTKEKLLAVVNKGFQELADANSQTSAQIFTPSGTIHSYKWTGDSEIDESEDLDDPEDIGSQDWALVNIRPPFYSENNFSYCGTRNSIAGYIRDEDLTYGEVYICSGNSGVQKGTLSGSTASIIMGKSIFEVRSIILEHELGISQYSQFP